MCNVSIENKTKLNKLQIKRQSYETPWYRYKCIKKLSFNKRHLVVKESNKIVEGKIVQWKDIYHFVIHSYKRSSNLISDQCIIGWNIIAELCTGIKNISSIDERLRKSRKPDSCRCSVKT
jgi:hypothetical protein